jgi:hypothetical protein
VSGEAIIWQAAPPSEREGIGVEMADLWSTLETPQLRVTGIDDRRFVVSVRDERGLVVVPPAPLPADGCAPLGPLPEGGYRAIVSPSRPGGPPDVGKPFLVLAP